MATRQQIIDQMNANAVAWYKTTDQNVKDQLHFENMQLAASLGLNPLSTFNSGSGTWNVPDVPVGSPINTTTDNLTHAPMADSTNIGAFAKDQQQSQPITNSDGSINMGGLINAGIGVFILVMMLDFFKR